LGEGKFGILRLYYVIDPTFGKFENGSQFVSKAVGFVRGGIETIRSWDLDAKCGDGTGGWYALLKVLHQKFCMGISRVPAKHIFRTV
jgi:hypothetical protein